MKKDISIEKVVSYSENIFQLNLVINGKEFILLVAKTVSENGISCLVGHDILNAFGCDENIVKAVTESIQQYEDSQNKRGR